VPPSLRPSAAAPGSLDAYISLSSQTASQGLELVYSLRVELSKLLEELGDRFPPPESDDTMQSGVPGLVAEQSSFVHNRRGGPLAQLNPTIPRLPYRVNGYGGLLYWQQVREGKIKPPSTAATADDDDNTVDDGGWAGGGGATSPSGGTNNSSGLSQAAQIASVALRAAGISAPDDPFRLGLPSVARPPPPPLPHVSPDNVLPALVLLNHVRVAARSVLSKAEDALIEAQRNQAEQATVIAQLQARLERRETRYGGGSSTSNDDGGSTTQQQQRRAFSFSPVSRRGVQFADSPPPPPPPLAGHRRAGSGFSDAALTAFDHSEAGANSVSSRISKQRAAALTHRRSPSSSSLDLTPASLPPALMSSPSLGNARGRSRDRPPPGSLRAPSYSPAAGPRSPMPPTGRPMSPATDRATRSREEALQQALLQSESALAKAQARARQLEDEATIASTSHTREITSMASSLRNLEGQLASQAALLSQRGVLLQLESIARRERRDKDEAQARYFAQQITEWETEVRQLLHPRKNKLIVVRAAAGSVGTAAAVSSKAKEREAAPQQQEQAQLPPGTTAPTTGTVIKKGAGKNRPQQQQLLPPSTGASSSESKEVSASQALAASPSASDEQPSKLQSQQLVLASSGIDSGAAATTAASAAGLYPASDSPLTALERSMKTPAGKTWLGKLLAQAPAATSAAEAAPVAAEEKKLAASSSNGGGGGGTVAGHLVAGADLLALDLLLVLDALFRREYTTLCRQSVELSASLRAKKASEARHEQVRRGDGSFGIVDLMTPPPAAPARSAENEEGSALQRAPDGGPTPAALAALMSALPTGVLRYLQALQRLFLAVYSRMPPSVAERFAALQSRSALAARDAELAQLQQQQQQHSSSNDPVDHAAASAAVIASASLASPILNTRVRDSMAAAVAAGNGKKHDIASATAASDSATVSVESKGMGSNADSELTKAPSAYASAQLRYLMDEVQGVPYDPFRPSPPAEESALRQHERAAQQQTDALRLSDSAMVAAAAAGGGGTGANGSGPNNHGSIASHVRRSSVASDDVVPAASSSTPNAAPSSSRSGSTVVPPSVSSYLARLELVLHKARSMAQFRGILIDV
jgi:hypothetical protein